MLASMTSTLTSQEQTGIRAFAARRPVTTFVTVVLSLGVPLLTLSAVLGISEGPSILVTAYLGLTGAALVITRWAGGPPAVRELLRRLLRWRFGIGRWLTIVFALPLLTIGVAAASGTLQAAPRGWAFELLAYLFGVLVFGALVLNVWEELGWAGFVQARLTDRHGLLTGALLTALPFGILHLPLAFRPGWTWSSAAVAVAAIVLFAPFLRYLLGMLYVDTAGSLLAVGIMHAAFNASGALGVTTGWQHIPAVVLLTLAVAILRRRRREDAT
jgi:membrane protease YdiL (CAAX protease family)